MTEDYPTDAEFAANLFGARESPSTSPPQSPMPDYREAQRQQEIRLLRALGLVQDEPEPEQPQEQPDFDGGAREPTPTATDPEQDHNDLIMRMIRGE